MSKNNVFPILLLIARPAAGKSEIIKYLSMLDKSERAEKLHIGDMHVIDDFPYLWRWFEEDHLLKKMGYPRLYTDEQGYFLHNYLWDLLIEMIDLEYEKSRRDSSNLENRTTIIEFSRGKEHGGYQQALPLLSPEILKNLAILYVDVPWEESLRKNRQRFNPDKPDSILEHSLPDEKLKRLYRECDFRELAVKSSEKIPVKGFEIPYAIFNNRDDVTTAMGTELGARLKSCLDNLWKIR